MPVVDLRLPPLDLKQSFALNQPSEFERSSNEPSILSLARFQKHDETLSIQTRESSRRIARVAKAVYVMIICGVSNSDSYVFW